METFVKIFRNGKVAVTAEEANIYAVNHGCEIVSAQLAFYGAGRPSEEAVLTVVYRKKARAARKKSGGGEDE